MNNVSKNYDLTHFMPCEQGKYIDGGGAVMYQIKRNRAGLTILDGAGNPMAIDEARQIINDLFKSYAPPAYVYLACNPLAEPMEYKIGYSTQDTEKRMAQLRYQEENDAIFLMHTIPCRNAESARAIEARYHGFFEEEWVRGEWFELPSHWVQALLDTEHEDVAEWKLHFYYAKWLAEEAQSTNGACFDGLSKEELDRISEWIRNDCLFLDQWEHEKKTGQIVMPGFEAILFEKK